MLSSMAMGRRAALFATAFAVLAAVGVEVVVRAAPSDARLVASTPTATADPNEVAARERVEQTAAHVPMLPHAVRLALPPVSQLDQPPLIPGTPDLIDQFTLWRAPGTVDAAIAWFTAHPPSGMTVGTRGDGTDQRFLAFQIDTMFTDRPTVLVDVVPDGGAVAVRVDVMAVWTPTKPARAFIGPVDSVDVIVLRPNIGPGNPPPAAPPVRATMTGAPAQRLADAIDALPVQVPGQMSCPVARGFSDHLTFHIRSGRTIDAAVSADGCPNVGVTADGIATTLRGTVDDQLMAELGLPANYGW